MFSIKNENYIRLFILLKTRESCFIYMPVSMADKTS